MHVSTPILQVRHGAVGYHDRPVLPDVSLTVPSGEVLAILGANGSGKSTLVRAALGLLPVTSGTVELFGTPLRRFRQWHRIGYVPQRPGAGSGVPATVTELVSSGRLPRRRLPWPGRAADRAAVAEAIATVGLTGRSRDPVATLSGGQQQRALIARALATGPELLVLDEPTAGVDSASQVAFAAALRGFVDGGGTVVLVAHELGPLEPLVTRSVVLHQGRVVHDSAQHTEQQPHPPQQPWQGGPDRRSEHVHPHAPAEPPGIWQQPTARELQR